MVSLKDFLEEPAAQFPPNHLLAPNGRSTKGGKGLAVYLAISPLELVPTTLNAQRATTALLGQLMALFNREGLGADPSALGLQRDFCNWRNKGRTLYSNLLILSSVQSARTPVVTTLLRYLRPFKLCPPYEKKSERKGLLYKDLRAETKLARLYTHLLEARDNFRDTVYMKACEIAELTGLSKPFLKKLLANPPSWLVTEYCCYSEGWALSLRLDSTLTQRAYELLMGLFAEKRDFSGPLKQPEEVEDGERNLWITKAALTLKHNGTSYEMAVELMKAHVTNIPGCEDSVNCKNVVKIVKCIYHNHAELLGINSGSAPAWLLFPEGEDLPRTEETHQKESSRQNPKGKSRPKNKKKTTFKKGGSPLPSSGQAASGKASLRQVSIDQCFVHDKQFYSLPKEVIGQKVTVFEYEGRLRVYDLDGNFVYNHDKTGPSRNRYHLAPSHFSDLNESQKSYLSGKVNRMKSYGDNLGAFAQNLVNEHGLLSVRKLWTLQGLRKQFGTDAVEKAAQGARNLRQLKQRSVIFKSASTKSGGHPCQLLN